MDEIRPGIFHWSAQHPRIRVRVHSHYLRDARTVLDPMVPEGVVEELRSRGGVERVVLTNRHHYRQADRLVQEFDCPVLCPEPGLHEFEGGPPVRGYAFGEEVAPALVAHEVDAICPDDAALHLTAGDGALAFADGLIRAADSLAFVPDGLMGEEPEPVKQGLRASLARLGALEFDTLLFAHGEPLPAGGRAALREFVEA